MDPRIILRGAIPIDSNIGGYGHRPLFWRGGVSWLVRLSCAFLVLCVAWSCGVVLARSVLCKDPVFRVLETCIFLSSRYYRVWPRYYRFGRHGTTAPQHGTTALVRYFGSTAPCGTIVSGHGTTAPSRVRGGYDSGRGVPTPHTHSLSLSPRLSLSRTAPEALAGSPSPATLLGFRPVGSFPTTSSCHGPRFFPKSLSFLVVLLLLGFWGETCCS